MKKQLLLLLLMMLPMVASAYDFEVDGIYYSLISIEEKTVGVTYDNNAYLKSYNGDIVIPSKVEYKGTEFTVTSILNVAFGSFNGGVITSVQLPETIKLIDSQAFWACKYLEEINLPNSLEVINYGAFADCSSLKRIVIPNSVVEINDYQTNRGIFQGCTSLESVVLSENIKKIPYRAFYNCINLLEIEIPKGVESIGGEAFCNCKKVKEIVIPEHVNNIGYKAFESCEELKSIKCLSSIPPVMYESFTNSHYMFTNLVVPPGTKEIYKSDENWGKFLNIEEELGEIYNLVYYINEEVYKSYEIRHGTSIIPEPAPSKDGYTFSGWSEIPATMPAHDVTVTGTFSINKYKLIYKVDGADYKTYELEYGATITPEPAPTKEGYTFSGWSEIPETMPANDVVITGTFSVNNYTLTYKVDGEVYKTTSVAYGTAITSENVPTKEGYTFSGWSEIPATMPANDVVITGTFSINQYTMTFVLDNGEENVVKTQDYASALAAPENLLKTGFTFKGWSPAVPATIPASDMTFTAQWERNKYLVTFIVEDSVVKKDSVLYEGTITKPADPVKEGYTFSGWSEIPVTMPANDVVITGTFTVNAYTVTFTYNDKVLKVDSVEYGAKITLPTSLDSERYTLVEWLDVPETMPAHDITIYASITDGIRNISNEVDYKIYDERGQQIPRMKRGLNIIRYSDGTIRKVIVK